MLKKSPFIALICILFFWSCDNEVELTTDFEEKTVVYGLLDQSQDTQFVKINRTFLEPNTNALQLAKDPSRLVYDNLTVNLIEKGSNKKIALQKILRPKNNGIFSGDRNELYFTNKRLKNNQEYDLEIIKDDGSITRGSTRTIFDLDVLSPDMDTSFKLARLNTSVSFIRDNNQIQDQNFEFRLSRRIRELEIRFEFIYGEVVRKNSTQNDTIERRVFMPIGRVINPNPIDPSNPDRRDNVRLTVNGSRFLNAIEAQVPADLTNPSKKVINDWNVEIEVLAADEDYSFYRDLNGPIDGLAQVRPEFTNISDGIGLFSSRYTLRGRTNISSRTLNYLVSTYRDNRNFVFP